MYSERWRISLYNIIYRNSFWWKYITTNILSSLELVSFFVYLGFFIKFENCSLAWKRRTAANLHLYSILMAIVAIGRRGLFNVSLLLSNGTSVYNFDEGFRVFVECHKYFLNIILYFIMHCIFCCEIWQYIFNENNFKHMMYKYVVY